MNTALEKAKALLTEAGFPEGFETTLHCPSNRYYKDASLATALAADLLKVGVKAQIKMMDWETYIPFILRDQEEAEHRLFVLGWSTLTGDADYGLYPLFYSGEWPRKGTNASFFKNEKLINCWIRQGAQPIPTKGRNSTRKQWPGSLRRLPGYSFMVRSRWQVSEPM